MPNMFCSPVDRPGGALALLVRNGQTSWGESRVKQSGSSRHLDLASSHSTRTLELFSATSGDISPTAKIFLPALRLLNSSRLGPGLVPMLLPCTAMWPP